MRRRAGTCPWGQCRSCRRPPAHATCTLVTNVCIHQRGFIHGVYMTMTMNHDFRCTSTHVIRTLLGRPIPSSCANHATNYRIQLIIMQLIITFFSAPLSHSFQHQAVIFLSMMCRSVTERGYVCEMCVCTYVHIQDNKKEREKRTRQRTNILPMALSDHLMPSKKSGSSIFSTHETLPGSLACIVIVTVIVM
jgi:hypothetical protein